MIPSIFAQTDKPERPKITGIAHIGLYTDDIQNAVSLFTDYVELMTRIALGGTPSPSTYGKPLRYDGEMSHLLKQ